MIIDKELMSLGDIAELCGTSKNNISNWRVRDSKFPTPYTETSAGPIWKAEDIVTYLQNKNEVDIISTGNLNLKRVAVIGRARGGKSFLISRFVDDRTGFVKLFCGNSSDKTACPINIKISDAVSFESYTFHTDFNSKFSKEDSDKESKINSIRERVSILGDRTYLQEDTESMKKIESLIRDIREIEANYDKQTYSYIDTYQKPSLFCKELLRESGLGRIEMIDTPGVSGEIEPSRTAKSDMYLFLIKPDNSEESLTLKKIVTAIKEDVATSKVAFLYKKEGFFITQKKYEEARNMVKKDMEPYSELFSDLRGNIISTELDILNPAAHSILFPTMDTEEVTLPEELFLQEIKTKLLSAFIPEDEKNIDNDFSDLVNNHGDEAKEFVFTIMSKIDKHSFIEPKKEYTIIDFRKGYHDRVMTNDGYRLRNDLDQTYNEEIIHLYDYFSKFKAEDHPEEWKQKIIKFIYRKLILSIRTDRGLGVGSHPLEERPARTMLIEESIIADSVLENILSVGEWSRNFPYRKAFIDNNISSKTWNYVGCRSDDEAVLKLKIVKECLLDIKAYSRRNMVLYRYIGGLRKVAQYNVFKLMGYSDEECMNIVNRLPF